MFGHVENCGSVIDIVGLDRSWQRVGAGEAPTWSPGGSEIAYQDRSAGVMVIGVGEDPGVGVDYMALYRFDVGYDLDRHRGRRLAKVVPAVLVRGLACQDGRRGLDSWRHGRLACWVSPNTRLAALRWTEEGTNTYGILNAKSGVWEKDLANLYRE